MEAMSAFTDKRGAGSAGRCQAPSRPPLADEAIDSVASWLQVIAEPTRIRLMERLGSGGANVQGLASQLGTTRQNVSRHLGILRQAGIVNRRRAGNWVLYELADFSGWWMVEQAVAALSEQD
jgi:DNA-binding transcriptional ArsR family regulator